MQEQEFKERVRDSEQSHNKNVTTIEGKKKEKEQEQQHIDCEEFLEWLFEKKPSDKFIEISKLKESKATRTVDEVLEIARQWDYADIYFSPNPRFRFSGKAGRATKQDVDCCLTFFMDFDFKKEVSEVPEDIKAELDKKGYVEQGEVVWIKNGNKFVKVEKPTYKEFIELIEPKLQDLGLDLDYVTIVDSGFGYHIYIRLAKGVKPSNWEKVQEMLIKHFNANEKTKNPDRLMRLPDTWNMKYKDLGLRKFCKVLKLAEKDVEFSKIKDRLKIILKEEEKVKEERREHIETQLSEDEIKEKADKIIEILKPYYRQGHRHNIILGLSGALRKAGWDFEQAKKLITLICKEFNDEELESNRIPVLQGTYKKESKEVSYRQLIDEIAKIHQTELGMDEDDAYNFAHQKFEKIAKIIGLPTRYVKSVISLKRMTTKEGNVETYETYYLNGEYVGIVRISEYKNETIFISDFYIDEIIEHEVINFSGECETKYTITFRNRFTNEEKRYEFLHLNDIVEKARGDGIAKNSKLFEDAVKSLIQKFRELRKVRKKTSATATGFFEVNGRLKWYESSRFPVDLNVDVEKFEEELREALSILTKIVEWYDNKPEVRAVICRTFIAPLGYIRKKHGIEQRIMVLCGEKRSGKTNLCKVVEAIWGISEEIGICVGRTSEARLGDILSKTTLPVTIDEGKTMLKREDIIEILKKSTSTEISREIIKNPMTREMTRFPAFASLYVTLNFLPMLEPAMEGRIIKVIFDKSFKKAKNEADKFWSHVLQRKDKLRAIGLLLSIIYEEYWDEIKPIALELTTPEYEIGRKLMVKALKLIKFKDIPEWLNTPIVLKDTEIEEEVDEVKVFFEYIREEVVNRFLKSPYGRDRDTSINIQNFEFVIACLRDSHMLPKWMYPIQEKYGDQKIIKAILITPEIIQEINQKWKVEISGGLKNLSEKVRERVKEVMEIDDESIEEHVKYYSSTLPIVRKKARVLRISINVLKKFIEKEIIEEVIEESPQLNEKDSSSA